MSNYLALYRRYRPSTFDGLIGQEHIVQTLVNQIKSNRLGHAYLFTGTRGTGKTSVAKIFAKAINCLSPVNGSPCGKCDVCKSLSDSSNIDIIEIDAASNNGVNEIRDIREKVQYPPVSCRKKVYIVDEVHMLTGAAFNALLKTLEEPPTHAVFILATTEVHKIPATILSRCMRFDFRLVSTDKIAQLICSIYDSEGKKYDNDAIYAIAKAGEGSVRDALSIADICISCGTDKLTYDDVTKALGVSDFDTLNNFATALLSGDVGAVLDYIDNLCDLGKSIGVLIKDLSSYLRDLIIIKNSKNAFKLLALPDSNFVKLQQIANITSSERLIRAIQIFSDAENDLRYTNHPRIIFETAAIKCCQPETDYNIDSLLARVKTLEDSIANSHSYSKTTSVIEVPKVINQVNEAPVNLSISSVTIEELKGKLLSGLRNLGREMLWNLLQDVKLEVNGNVLSLVFEKEGDYDVVNRDDSKQIITKALDSFNAFQLEVVLSDKNRKLSEIDLATERMKKIFGADIVIDK